MIGAQKGEESSGSQIHDVCESSKQIGHSGQIPYDLVGRSTELVSSS